MSATSIEDPTSGTDEIFLLPNRAAEPQRHETLVVESRTPKHRNDIQVLRCLAVVLVVLYHLNVPGFGAGFIGVDIFFVISGYLITRLLLVEIDTTGTIDLGRFLARRVRRLLPMSFLVLGVTLLLLRSRSSQAQQLFEITIAEAAATYRANFALAQQGTDYLTSSHVSAFQHYWSLAVEEQFYVLLPLLLFVVAKIVGRGAILRAAIGVMVIAGGASLLWAIVATLNNPSDAFFLLQYRAWEFIAGGLLATTELRGHRPSTTRSWRTVGLIGIVVAMIVTPYLAFPGPGALPAVTATTMLVWGGVAAQAGDAAGPRWAVARWVGDRSYSIYLWHWPPIVVFGLDETPVTDRLLMRVGVIVITLIASAVTYELVEKPLRNASVIRSTPRAIGLLIAISVIGFVLAGPILRPSIASVFGPPSEPVAASALLSGPPGIPDQVPENIRPALQEANADRPDLADNGCNAPLFEPQPGPIAACTFGGSGAGGTVALVGDSHASHWFDGLEASALNLDAELVVMTKSSCSLTGVPDERAVPACEQWRTQVLYQLAELQPDVVVAANVGRIAEREDPTEWSTRVRSGLDDITAATPDAGIVFILAVPFSDHDVPSCLAESTPADCSVPSDPAFDDVQRAAVDNRADVVVEPSSWLCRDGACSPFIGNALIYRDSNHLSGAAALMLSPLLTDALIEAGLR